MLSGAVYIAVRVGFFAGYRANVDDVAAFALYHARYNRLAYIQQPFNVNVYHGIPVVYVAIFYRVKAVGIAGIVYKHIYGIKIGRERCNGLCHFFLFAHIKV